MSTECPPFPRFRAKVLDQAVIQDESGAVIFNLALENRVAVRVSCKYRGRKVCVIVPVSVEDASQFDRPGVISGPVRDLLLEAVRRAGAQKRSRG